MDEEDEGLYFAKLDEYVKRTTQAKVQDGDDKVKNGVHGTPLHQRRRMELREPRLPLHA